MGAMGREGGLGEDLEARMLLRLARSLLRWVTCWNLGDSLEENT